MLHSPPKKLCTKISVTTPLLSELPKNAVVKTNSVLRETLATRFIFFPDNLLSRPYMLLPTASATEHAGSDWRCKIIIHMSQH